MRIVTVHGEGSTLFHVVDASAPDAEQPAILATYHNRADAESMHRQHDGQPCPYPLRQCPFHGTDHGKGVGILENPNMGGSLKTWLGIR